MFITNERRCRYSSFQDAGNDAFRGLLRGSVIACWNNQNGVSAIEIYYVDGEGQKSKTVSRVPF